MINRRTFSKSALAAVSFAGSALVVGSAAFGQKTGAMPNASAAPKSAPSAAAPAVTPAPTRNVTLNFARPGTYDYWLIGATGPGPVLTATPGAKSIPISIATDTVALNVLAGDSGLVATVPAAKLAGASVTVSPNDFDRLRTVKINVTAGGRPVEKAQVALTDSVGKTTARVLTADDSGAATFNDVPLGKATIVAAYGSTGVKTSNDITLAPAKGGGALIVPITLAGDVPTLAPSPSSTPAVAAGAAAPAAAAPPPPNEPNNWFPGFISVVFLVVAGYYGLRYARNRGVTVESALKKIGVETPATAPTSPVAGLKPAPAPLPPLPSLSELPPAGAAPAAAASSFSSPSLPLGAARLVGLAGTVSGEVFDLDEHTPLTIGRDAANTLALAQDTGISRRHARISRSPSGWQIVDEGSSNGSFVNGARIDAATRTLRSGDEIQIGGSRFRFEGG